MNDSSGRGLKIVNKKFAQSKYAYNSCLDGIAIFNSVSVTSYLESIRWGKKEEEEKNRLVPRKIHHHNLIHIDCRVFFTAKIWQKRDSMPFIQNAVSFRKSNRNQTRKLHCLKRKKPENH